MSMPNNAPIFVCGTGRSGTTILQYLLSKHPRIYSLRYESRFIVHDDGLVHFLNDPDIQQWFYSFKQRLLGEWYRRVYRQGTPREYVGGLCSDVDQHQIEGLLARLEDGLGIASSRDDRAILARDFIESMFGIGMRETQKSRFLEKTPSNLLYMTELLEMFPEAKLIHIIRDGRDVATSVLRNQFWPINPTLLRSDAPRPTAKTVRNAAIFWRDFLEFGIVEGRKLPASTYLEIRMEDLVQDPERQLDKVFEHIEEEPDYDIVRFLDPSRAHIGSWTDMFERSDVEAFKEEAGQLLIDLGYEQDENWSIR